MPSSPAGWDSLNKISLLEQNPTKYRSGEDFEKVVPKPAEEVKTTNKEPTLTAVDDQVRGLLEGGFVNSAHVIYANGIAFGGRTHGTDPRSSLVYRCSVLSCSS